MNALMSEFSSAGFQVLGFPCNNFNLQEPGSNYSEILDGIKWVRPGNGYVPHFTMFKKIDVNGENEHPLYTFLKSTCGPTSDTFEDRLFYSPLRVSDVRWNFEVFLINKFGIPLYRFSPDASISDIGKDIQTLIKGADKMSNEIPTDPRPESVEEQQKEKENIIVPQEEVVVDYGFENPGPLPPYY